MRFSNQNILFNVNYGIPTNPDILTSGKLHFGDYIKILNHYSKKLNYNMLLRFLNLLIVILFILINGM